jgi:hypothetical protein
MDIKPFKEFFPSREQRFERAYRKRLPEAARTGQEINLPGCCNPVDVFRFIYIQIIIISNILERLYSYGQIFHD